MAGNFDRAYCLAPLQAAVQYMGRDDRPDVSPDTWTTMAAFDSIDMANTYAAKCGDNNSHWQYRVINLESGTAVIKPEV